MRYFIKVVFYLGKNVTIDMIKKHIHLAKICQQHSLLDWKMVNKNKKVFNKNNKEIFKH